MDNPFKNFFHYSNGERRGTLALLGILLIVLLFYFYQQWKPSKTEEISESDQVIIEYLNSNKNAEKHSYQNSSIDTNNLFQFDPNEIGIEEWQKLGFSEKQAESIEKYKSSGAKFYKKEDVKKLYVVDEVTYTKLEPYISISNSKSNQWDNDHYSKLDNKWKDEEKDESLRYRIVTLINSSVPIYSGFELYPLEVRYTRTEQGFSYVMIAHLDSASQMDVLLTDSLQSKSFKDISSLKGYYPVVFKKKEFKPITVEVNSADTTQLKLLSGIGSSFAKRIVKFRDLIGGFRSKEQLKEVYGIDEDKYLQIEKHILIDTSMVSKININKATVEELKSHPYISWNVANSIFHYRKSHGNYEQVEDIKNSDLINDELFIKIAPYITVK